MRHEQVEGGSAVVIAVIGETKVLLIKNLDRPDPKWKLIAETNKPGESIFHTVYAGLIEEAGMKDLKTELGADGKVARFTDPRIKRVVEFGERQWLANARKPHWRHFFGVLTTDEVIHDLSGEHHHIEEDDGRGGKEVEHIETMEFSLQGLDSIHDLLRPHAELIRSIPQQQMKEVA